MDYTIERPQKPHPALSISIPRAFSEQSTAGSSTVQRQQPTENLRAVPPANNIVQLFPNIEFREQSKYLTYDELMSKEQIDSLPVAMGSEDVLFAVYWSLINEGFPESRPGEFPRVPMAAEYDREDGKGKIYDIALRLVQIGIPGLNRSDIQAKDWRQKAKVIFEEQGIDIDRISDIKLERVWEIIQQSFARNNVSSINVTAYTRWASTSNFDSSKITPTEAEFLHEDYVMFREQAQIYQKHLPNMYFVRKKGEIDLQQFREADTRYMVHLENIQTVAAYYYNYCKQNTAVAFERLIRTLTKHGVGVVSLEYDTNGLLTSDHDLTNEGRALAHDLLDNGIVLDLAHSRDHIQAQILDLAAQKDCMHLIAYTHGAPVEAIAENNIVAFQKRALNRGISNERIETILKSGGYVGFTPTKSFFNSTEHFLQSLSDTITKYGSKGIGLALDMCGVPPEELLIVNPSELKQAVSQGLRQRGHDEETIKRVLFANHAEWIAN